MSIIACLTILLNLFVGDSIEKPNFRCYLKVFSFKRNFYIIRYFNNIQITLEVFIKMNLDKKTIVVTLSFLLVLVVVGFNFEKFTGQYAFNKPFREAQDMVLSKVYVSNDPSIVKMDNPRVLAGKKVYFTIEVGTDGSKRKLSIYRAAGGPRVANIELDQNCGGNKCRPGRITWGDYRIPNDWEGEYCGRVFDYGIMEYVKPGACFTVY